MSYSNDPDLFWELIEQKGSVLYLDNDCCYITYPSTEDEEEDDSVSFDFGPRDLAIMFADELNIETSFV